LMLNQQGNFLIADTGSTNGTFINGERIAYGRAFEIGDGDQVKIGNIEVYFHRAPRAAEFVTEDEDETEVRQTPNQQTVSFENTDYKTENITTQNQNELAQNQANDIRQTEEAVVRQTEPGIKFDFRDDGKE